MARGSCQVPLTRAITNVGYATQPQPPPVIHDTRFAKKPSLSHFVLSGVRTHLSEIVLKMRGGLLAFTSLLARPRLVPSRLLLCFTDDFQQYYGVLQCGTFG